MFAESVVEGSAVDRFDDIVRRFPSRLAVQDTADSLTYAELSVLVDRVAAAVAEVTRSRAGPIALLIPADADLPAAMLGVLAAGRAYVALDVEFPAERNASIIADAGACAVIASGEHIDNARTLFPDVPIIGFDNCPNLARPALHTRLGPDDLAAIYFTSGSSGRPKGIAWNHRNLLHRVWAFTNVADITCVDRTVLVASPSVSVAYRSIYCALLNGASVHTLSPRRLGLAALTREIRSRGITIYHSVPTLIRRIAESLGAGERLDTIRIVHTGGERVRWSDMDDCKRCFSRDVRVCMGLSSTEAGPCMEWIVDEALRDTAAYPPVGRPVRGWKITIVGADGEPVADGESGEIIATSRFVAPGYWRGRDHQISPFPSDPADPMARVFTSGDRGQRRADGLIEFTGRHDARIKLHGHRIELAEIEAVLTTLGPVRDAALVVRYDGNSIPISLVAYVAQRPGVQGLLPRNVQAMLAQRLPRYMVPSQVFFGDLPYLPSLKIDRAALARLDARKTVKGPAGSDGRFVEKILGIFERVLGFDGATPEDSVASLGGDSLQEISVFAELERHYGVTIPDAMINQRPTIGSIASWIESLTAHSTTRAAS